MNIDFKVKDLFFDREAVKRATDAGKLRGLSKFGAFVRTAARSLLRRRKRSAAAGQPPSVHSSDENATLKKIFFFYEPARETCVVGPVKLNGQGDYVENVTVPQLQEFGGVVTLKRARVIPGTKAGRGKRGRKATAPVRLAAGERLSYADHPFMGPALAKTIESGKVSDAWGGVVRSS